MHFDESIRISASSSRVYDLLTDVQDWAVTPGSPVKSMEKRPAGPTVVGTRWREVVRVFPGLSLTMSSEVTDLQPGRLLGMRFWGGHMEGTLTYTVTDVGSGAVLRQQESLHVLGPLRRFGWLVDRMLEPRLRCRLRDIRDALEADGRD